MKPYVLVLLYEFLNFECKDEFACFQFQSVYADNMKSLITLPSAWHVHPSLPSLPLNLHFLIFCSALLLGFGELSLESLLCW